MPKKTKKEKIIAEYRRKLQVVSGKSGPSKSVDERSPAVSQPTYSPTFTIPQEVSTNRRTDTISIDPQEFTAIKKDLIKTLILTCCIIVGQIVIWRVVG